ncbi:hypothetical protein [uncultured Ruegeria sp.]|uniref:hypothetical protein n=1 Tax=uncultured Ruegeria sp. TaxID=259304 RepID=UPI00260246E6|nr:hypothetical protein [uncultured Ruegeria sp.]
MGLRVNTPTRRKSAEMIQNQIKNLTSHISGLMAHMAGGTCTVERLCKDIHRVRVFQKNLNEILQFWTLEQLAEVIREDEPTYDPMEDFNNTTAKLEALRMALIATVPVHDGKVLAQSMDPVTGEFADVILKETSAAQAAIADLAASIE